MISHVFLLVLILIFAGCSSSTLVSPTSGPGTMAIDQFNLTMQDEEGTILFDDGSRAYGRSIRIERDSASWRDPGSNSLFHVPLARIRNVSTGPNRFVGGIIGFAAGGACGALAGWRIADGVKADHESKALNVALGTIGGAAGGALIGTIVGIVTAQPSEYEFKNDASDK